MSESVGVVNTIVTDDYVSSVGVCIRSEAERFLFAPYERLLEIVSRSGPDCRNRRFGGDPLLANFVSVPRRNTPELAATELLPSLSGS